MLRFLDRVRMQVKNIVSSPRYIQAQPFFAMYGMNRERGLFEDDTTRTQNGFRRNPIVHRCIKLISETAAALPWFVREDGQDCSEHPLTDLLNIPNNDQSGPDFFENLYAHMLVSGNVYIHAVEVSGQIKALYNLRPDRVQIVLNHEGWPVGYDYRVGSACTRFAQGSALDNEFSEILHLKLFNPTDDHYGLSPLEACRIALDIHTAASTWNKSLLDNAARPSGALVYKGVEGSSLTDSQFDRLKQELEEQFQGARNAGRPFLLEGGLDWKALSLSPRDMDFIETKAMAAREIALAFGVPPLLLGLPGDNTYGNFAEANRAFLRHTVIPLAQKTASRFAQWLGPHMGHKHHKRLSLELDLEHLDALASEREALWRRVTAADFLSSDEKREAVGYGKQITSENHVLS
jgi:HK97 family phage portal protein